MWKIRIYEKRKETLHAVNWLILGNTLSKLYFYKPSYIINALRENIYMKKYPLKVGSHPLNRSGKSRFFISLLKAKNSYVYRTYPQEEPGRDGCFVWLPWCLELFVVLYFFSI